MTEGRTKQTLNAPLPFYGGGIKIHSQKYHDLPSKRVHWRDLVLGKIRSSTSNCLDHFFQTCYDFPVFLPQISWLLSRFCVICMYYGFMPFQQYFSYIVMRHCHPDSKFWHAARDALNHRYSFFHSSDNQCFWISLWIRRGQFWNFHRILTSFVIIENMDYSLTYNTCEENKEKIWLSPITKAPTPTEMSKGQSDNTNNATKKCGYTEQLRTDLLRSVGVNYGHPTGVVNLVYRPNLPTPRNSRVIKRTSTKCFKIGNLHVKGT